MMDEITRKNIAFDNDTVAYLLYMYLDAIDTLVEDMETHLSKIGSGWRKENKRAYNNVAASAKRLRQHIDIANQIIYKVGAKPYDTLRDETMWMIRMNLLLLDRLGVDDVNSNFLEEKLKEYKSNQYVSQSRIDSFKIKK